MQLASWPRIIRFPTIFFALQACLVGAAAPDATIEGIVVENKSGRPVAGATVLIEGEKTTTDSLGKFRFLQSTTGHKVISITAPGHAGSEVTADLVPGKNTLPPAQLVAEAVVVLENFVVSESKDGTAAKFSDKAGTETLTESISGAALNKPNAQNSTDLLKNTSGVTVNGGATGASTVSVRGIDQRMLRITVDGQRQGGSGNPLDSIPAEIVQSLEVTKTFTPDMEADTVGGTINVNTGGSVVKAAFVQGRHQFTYNTLEPRLGFRNSFTVAEPFRFFSVKPNASFSATGSFEDQYKVRERLSNLRQWTPQVSPGPSPYVGQSIAVLTLPLIEATQEHRQRTGLLMNADARLHDTSLYLRANLGRDWVARNRNYNDSDPSSGAVQSLTPTTGTFSGVEQSRRNQRVESFRDSSNISVGGKSQTDRLTFDANLGYAWTDEYDPRNYETGFVTDHTYRATYDLARNPYQPVYTYVDETNPIDTQSGNDPKRYGLDYLQVSKQDATDGELSLKANLKVALGDSAKSENYLKFGGKVQQRRRSVNIDREVYNRGSQPRDLTGLVGDELLTMETVGYTFGALPNADAVGALLQTSPNIFANNATQSAINSGSGDYHITENVWALYGMGKFKRGPWTWIGGVRVEGTEVDSKANQMVFDSTGQFIGLTPTKAKNSYVEILPGLHLRYDRAGGLLYRASITRSLSRPAYVDIAPFRTLSFIDHRSRVGSPELKPYQSTNFDLSADKYTEGYGLFSFAVFYKKIDHFITDQQSLVTIGDLGDFIEFKRINGEAALAYGFEFNWQSRSWALPGGLGKGTLEANYSFNHGEAHHPGRPNEVFPLPRQVDHQGSIHLRAEHGPFSIDTSVRYRTGWWEDLIAAGFDNFIEPAWDADLSVAYKVGKNTRITAGVTNLLNVPVRHYAGTHNRMNDYQRSGVDLNFGVQWKM